MNQPPYPLTPEAAVARMRATLNEMEAEPDRNQLRGMTPDDAYEMGYRSAIQDFASLTHVQEN